MVIKPQEERTREECKKKDLEKQTENRASFCVPVVFNPPASAGDTALIPGPGRSHMCWNN